MTQTLTPPANARIYNPVQRDAVTFLETSEQSGGVRTPGLLEVAPGGKVLPHFHGSYTEEFTAREGTLTVDLDGVRHTLEPGASLLVPRNAEHGWSNPGADTAFAEIEVRPGQPGFELTLRVGYGLARDGRVFANGMPRNPLHLGLMMTWGDIRPASIPAPFFAAMRGLAAVARQLGVERSLKRRYDV